MTRRLKRASARLAQAWGRSTSRAYIVALFSTASWRVALNLALVLCVSATQGAQLLLLVPLMQLVGLDAQHGAVGWLADFVSSAFAVVDIRPTLVTVLAAYALFATAQALVTRYQKISNSELEEGFVVSLRRRLYKAIAHTDWLTFVRGRSSDFTHALTTELDRVGDATHYFLSMIAGGILLSVYVFLALQLSSSMSMLVFFCGAGLLLALRKKARAARWTGEEISEATNGLYNATLEHLGGMKTAKSYGAEERNVDLFSGLAGKVAQTYLNATRRSAETEFWFQVGSVLALCAILYVAFEVMMIPAAGLLLLLFLFARMIPQFARIQENYQQYLNALPAFEVVMKMQARCEASTEPKLTPPGEIELRQEVRFCDASFAYGGDGEDPTIRNANFAIEAGKITAIVGPSGAGKSTIADLVMGLIVPDKGQVLVDGAPLSPERMSTWRRRIGYVAQDTFLFNDSIKANLLWACPNAQDEEIEWALRSAAAYEFVSELPEGIQTRVGDRGVRLSGGERQRLALARALLRKPSLLILDEATSALDSENEEHIRSAIEELRGYMSILLITHRLSTVRGADVIHVLEKGRVSESGSWAVLLGRENGRFKALCRAQGISDTLKLNRQDYEEAS